VTVTGIEIGAEVLQRKRDLAGRMRAVYDGDDPAFARAADQFTDRQNQRGRRCDVADDEDARSLSHARPDLLNHLRMVARWQADWLRTIDRIHLLGQKAPRALDRAVLMVRSQDLIARAQ
jgi:hypothetical protein